MRLPLVGVANSYRSKAAGAQTCINLYPEPAQDPQDRKKGMGSLYGCPGRHAFADIGGPNYALWSNTTRLFAVVGNGTGRDLVEVNSFGTVISRHTISSIDDGNPAQIVSNGLQLLILSANLLYCDSGSGPAQCFFEDGITPVDATSITYLDGYFVCSRVPGGVPDRGRQINISALLDGRSWSTLDYTSAEAEPSYVRQVLADNEQLYVFKDASIQICQDNPTAGVGGFPLANVPGAMSRYGVISAWGAVSLAGKIYFIGFPGGVGASGIGWISAYVMDGFTPRKVSGYAQDYRWRLDGLGSSSTPAIGFAYSEDGHDFWITNFGFEGWAFDPGVGGWHERQDWDDIDNTFVGYTTYYHAFVERWGTAGQHITGGPFGHTLYVSSIDFYDDNGGDLAWRRDIPYEYEGGNLIYYGRMYLEAETGTAPSGPIPAITRSYSDDRGQTFVGAEDASLGATGAFSTRVIWPLAPFSNSMGRVFRFFGAGKGKVALIDLQADITYGTT